MTANLIYELIAQFQEDYGFDPQGVYCQFTGKRVGSFDDSEFDALVESLAGMDREEMIDDLAMRVLASMRPSMRWNKLRTDSLAVMRERAPVDTLAYLINRMFAPLHWRKLGVEPMLGFYADRIKCYQLVESWGQTDETNTLTYMLLELDAKWNLDTESAPFNAWDFFRFDITMAHRVDMVQQWYNRRMADWSKKLKDDELQVKWEQSRTGNALAKPAFMAAFLEAKPLSPTGIKKAEKAQEKAFMAGLLSEIMMGRVETVEEGQAVEPKPEFVPIRKMPLAFGVK